MATPQASDYHPLSPEVCADPYPYYAALRRESPLHRLHPELPFFAVSRFDDVHDILQRPESFSSSAWRAIATGAVPLSADSAALGQSLADHRLFVTPNILQLDPPAHGPLRGLINRGFTPRRIGALEARLRRLAGELLDPLVAAKRFDVMADLAVPFPMLVIAEILGIDPKDRERFKTWSDAVIATVSDVAHDFSPEQVRSSMDELTDYLDAVIAERRAQPGDDLISTLVRAEEGASLENDQILTFVNLLLVAGNETTTNLIGNAIKALLHHPEQLAEVADDPALVPAMLEEVLRFESPVQGVPRMTTAPAALASGDVPENAFLLVLIGSANRDAARFPDPDRFDVHRNPQGHLAFGFGIHFCLGAALARLEARVVFEELFRRTRRFAGEEAGPTPMNSGLLRGPRELPISVSPA